jgi:hypothetical protein
MSGKQFSTRECYFYVIPDTFLFVSGLAYLPVKGTLVDYLDVETGVTTRYKVQDVILEVREVAAVPPSPPDDPGSALVHEPEWRVEIKVFP